MLDKIADRRLKPFAIWVPKSRSVAEAVPEGRKVLPDPRVEHFWDEDGVALKAFRAPLELDQDAWDLYLLYRPGILWEGSVPPKPTFWMHQLYRAPNAPMFDGEIFAAKVKEALQPDTIDHTKTSTTL